MGNLVKFGSYDLEAAAAEEKALVKTSADYMKLGVGKNILRFLPPPAGVRSPFVIVHEHYLTPPGETRAKGFACPRMMARKVCPVCTMGDTLSKTGNPADREAAREYWPRRRIYANVIDRKEPEAGPKILAFGKTIHDALVAIRKDEDAGGDFTHPITGFDIVVERKGIGKNDTEYKVLASRKQSPLAADAETAQVWIDNQHPVANFSRLPDLTEISEMLGTGVTVDVSPRTVPQAKPKPSLSVTDAEMAEDDLSY